MSKINFLPPWAETNLQPAFYDVESGTSLQQTARMYNKVNELVRTANTQNEIIADYIEQFNELHDYVYDYFDNLDIQQEVNHKIDRMVETGEIADILANVVDEPIADMQQDIRTFESSVNGQINQFNIKLDAIGNGSPLVASDVSGMTDTTKVYVNTTNGKWYYYDGDSWEIGGDFQSAGIGDGTVNRAKVSFHQATGQLFDVENPDLVHLIPNENTGKLYTHANSTSLVIPCEADTDYVITITGRGRKFVVFGTENYPGVGEDYLNELGHVPDSTPTLTQRQYHTDVDANYLCVFFWNTTADGGWSYTDRINSIIINKGTTAIPWNYMYNLTIREQDIVNGSVTKDKLAYSVHTGQLFDYKHPNIIHAVPNSDQTALVASPASYVLYIPCEPETEYSVQKFFGGTRFCIFDTATLPSAGVDIGNIYGDPYTATETSKRHFTTSASANYLGFFFYNSNADGTISYGDDILSQIMINEGDDYESLTVPYIVPVTNFDILDDSIEANKIKVSKETLVGLDVFKTIGCVGDSYTEGYFNINGSTFVDKTLSYPASIARHNGNTVINYGKSGATTRSYVTSTLPTVITDSAKSLYILALGINDANQLGLPYLGELADIHDSDPSLNADTFYGNYGKIVQNIKNHAQNAKFVFVGCMRPSSLNANYGVYTTAIEEIAEHYGATFYDPMDDDAFNYAVLTTLSGGHPTATGYNAIARVMERNISRLINERPLYFLNSSL